MKKTIIISLLFVFLLTSGAFAQSMRGEAGFEEALDRLQEATDNLRGRTHQGEVESIGERVRDMRKDAQEDGEDFGQRVSEMAREEAERLREQKRERVEEVRERVNQIADQAPENVRRFKGLPEGLNRANQQITTRYESFLEEVEGLIGELEDMDLTDEEEEKLEEIKEEAADLWESLPGKMASDYFEDLEDVENPQDLGPGFLRVLRGFRDNHVDFMQRVNQLRREARVLAGYEEEADEEDEENEEEDDDEEDDNDENEEDEQGDNAE